MSKFEPLLQALKKFRDERDWEQFHNAKDLALAIIRNTHKGRNWQALIASSDPVNSI